MKIAISLFYFLLSVIAVIFEILAGVIGVIGHVTDAALSFAFDHFKMIASALDKRVAHHVQSKKAMATQRKSSKS